MKKLLPILFFAAFVAAIATPILGPATAFAGPVASDNDNCQGNNNNQGEDGD